MFGVKAPQNNFSTAQLRRKDLVNMIKEEYPDVQQGIIVLFANFEQDRAAFRQDSTFYYFTALEEPGVSLVMALDRSMILFIPNCGPLRKQWAYSVVTLETENAKKIGYDQIVPLGQTCVGYQIHPFFPVQEYENLIALIKQIIDKGGSIFTAYPITPYGYVDQRLIVERLKTFIPDLEKSIVDISPLIAAMRQTKDMREIEHMFKAAEITSLAQEAAAKTIKPGASEAQVQASIEYNFTASFARAAFPSIVASGKNSTVLHYNANNQELKAGDLVVVDIGAEYNYYCADITRTYPVSGTFTKRQRELYDIVLETQEYIASIAKPGMYLNNNDHADKSLNHLARKYIAKLGYEQYFIHGIGHYLGLDVHDVGDYTIPLADGDVITIEPGIYIAQEQIGIRIEDDYWIAKDGAVCLSEYLPKKAEDIEAMVQQSFQDVENEEDDIESSEPDEFDDDDTDGELSDDGEIAKS